MKKLILRAVLGGVVLLGIAVQSSTALASPKPVALIWKGPGACWPDCWPEAANVARRAGFKVKFITPQTTDFSVFDDAKLWVQPGGKSVNAVTTMGPALVEKVRSFIENGGGYAGFCAGMFAATEIIGTSDTKGFGIVPGHTQVYLDSDHDHAIYPIETENGTRYMYYAGGPYIDISDADLVARAVEVTGRYPNGKIASLKTTYGAGKVAVSGFHPEIGDFWKWIQGYSDPDGSDKFFAIDMMKYAAGL